MAIKYKPEPFRIKMIEPIKMLTREERIAAIKRADYNLFKLNSDEVYIDLLTDSGTGAMSQNQWSGLMLGDEAYAGGASYHKFVNAVKDIFGVGFAQPVHQGRAAEKVLFPHLLTEGKFAISNTFFDTTRAHVVLAGGRPIDCCCPEGKNPSLRAKFKGNMDVKKMEEIILEKGPENIGLVVMTITNNSAGGQPVSLQNMKDVAAICKKYNIHLTIDAARYAENAYFVKRDEEACKDMSIREIIKAFFALCDTFTMSSKKDAIVNMGGCLGVRDENSPLILKIKASCISYEGFYTYGGLSGRDLETLAVGLYEGIDESYLEYRIGQMEYLGSLLDDAGIIYQSPVGGHGVFVDAKSMFPNIPYTEFPGHTLAVELYIEAGIRSCEIGSFMLDVDPDTGKQQQAANEFTRLAVPRRVYTQAHFDVIADALITIKARSNEIKRGYRITWEPPILRHFQASLEPIKD